MHKHQEEPYYAFASAGALVDPAFLRASMMYANGGRVESSPLSSLRLRWHAAIQALDIVLRRR